MQLVIFEDHAVQRLMPLVGLKPAYGLIAGALTLLERFERHLDGRGQMVLHMRRSLAPAYAEAHPDCIVNRVMADELLLFNGRMLCTPEAASFAFSGALGPGTAIFQGDDLLFARLPRHAVLGPEGMMADLLDVERIGRVALCREVSGFSLLSAPWDPVRLHPEALRLDSACAALGRIEGALHPSAVIVEPSNVHVARGASIMAGAVLDGSDGPVVIGEGAVVEPNAVLMDGVFIGPSARVKACSRIYSNVSVGRFSKVGGEVEDAIVEPYANKQHDGFLGHSYISSWCNLGAGTTTSDLKNNYGHVRVRIGGVEHQTGQQFLGLLMGEHSKCAIGTLFNTGSVVGFACNVFGSGFPPKEIPSFSWGGSGGLVSHDAGKALETARTVMARRHMMMGEAYQRMFLDAAREG